MRCISVILVDESPLFRMAISSVLRGLEFSVSASDKTLLGADIRRKPDIVLINTVTLTGGPSKLGEFVSAYARIAPVLLLAREDGLDYVIAGLRAGALGFIKQTTRSRDLGSAITAMVKGKTWCDKMLLQSVAKYLPDPRNAGGLRLTKRENEVLSQVAMGLTNKEIAERMGLSVQSIKVYVSSLFRKTGTTNRSALLFYTRLKEDTSTK